MHNPVCTSLRESFQCNVHDESCTPSVVNLLCIFVSITILRNIKYTFLNLTTLDIFFNRRFRTNNCVKMNKIWNNLIYSLGDYSFSLNFLEHIFIDQIYVMSKFEEFSISLSSCSNQYH